MKLFPALHDRLGERGADAAPFVSEQGKQADGGAAEVSRHVLEGGHADRREYHRQATDQHDPRPDHLRGADVEIHQRHPVVAASHDDQAAGDQPAGVGAATEHDADDEQHHDRENAGGRLDQSRSIGVVAEQRLQAGPAATCWRRRARRRHRR